jgi:maltooligosyltrehalose trehalohydrolase
LQSAEPATGGVHFRVWAPRRSKVEVVPKPARCLDLARESPATLGVAPQVVPARCIAFDLDAARPFHPASRFQPEGPHGPSEIIDPTAFR